MTRKDFEMIAAVIRKLKEEHGAERVPVSDLISRFTQMCAKTNPNFNYSRFLKACGIDL